MKFPGRYASGWECFFTAHLSFNNSRAKFRPVRYFWSQIISRVSRSIISCKNLIKRAFYFLESFAFCISQYVMFCIYSVDTPLFVSSEQLFDAGQRARLFGLLDACALKCVLIARRGRERMRTQRFLPNFTFHARIDLGCVCGQWKSRVLTFRIF